MAVQDYSATPAANVTINGINIAEGCAPGNINDAVRSLMADIRVMYNGIPSTANFMPKSGGAFTANPTYQGRGGYLHHNDPANTGGRVFIQAIGGAVPTMVDGDFLLEW